MFPSLFIYALRPAAVTDKMFARLDEHTTISALHLVDAEDTDLAFGAYVLFKLLEIREHLIICPVQSVLCPPGAVVAEESQFMDGLKSSRGIFVVPTNGHLHLFPIVLV
jgi:hypothetical protein